MSTASPSWSVAIIAARETIDTLSACVSTALAASAGKRTVIDVIVNGNPHLAAAAARMGEASAWSDALHTVRVWSLPVGDKAHAWNQYVHAIWPGSDVAFFLDGYALARPDAFAALARRLAAEPEALAVTGVPSAGRSAAKTRASMIQNGGIQGNMHALHGKAMTVLRDKHVRLPLGLYRTDSLIGAIMMYKIEPESASAGWDKRRLVVVPEATWDVPGLSRLTIGNVKSQAKRYLRQAQGVLENRAMREHLSIRRLPAAELPVTSRDLVRNWISAHPGPARSIFLKQPACLYAAYKLREQRDWSQAAQAPQLVYDAGTVAA
jgi:hypothetical protein